MLGLSVRFLRGLYVAASPIKSEPECPLHASRLYSALVDIACTTGRRHLLEILRELEDVKKTGLPEIHSGIPHKLRAPAERFMPVVGKPDKSAKSKVGGFHTQIEFSFNPRREVEHKRAFRPSVWFKDPWQVFLWQHFDPSDALKAALDELCPDITHLGTGESLVEVMRFEDVHDEDVPLPLPMRYVPNPSGDVRVRVATLGTMDALEDAFQRGEHYYGWTQAAYECLNLKQADLGPWTVGHRFALRGSQPVHATRSMLLVDRLRKAVLSLGKHVDVPSIVHGHGPDGRPLNDRPHHVAFLPMPYAGFRHATGFIKGVAMGVPRSCSADEARRIEDVAFAMDDLEFAIGPDTYRLERLEEGDGSIQTLRASAWACAATRWTTVTPVVLDSWPRPSAEASLRRSFEKDGYPAPKEVRFSRTPFFTGGSARSDMYVGIQDRVAKMSGPRLWGHVLVEWDEPVRGPVLLGRLRHFGTGLMLPHPRPSKEPRR